MKFVYVAFLLMLAAVARAERAMSLGDYSDEVQGRVAAKIREALSAGGVAEVSGTVTFAGWGSFFLQRDDDGLKVFYDGKLPDAGDVVTVEGSPSLEGGRVVLVAKEWRKTATAPLPEARPVLLDELVESSGSGGVNWLRVALAGRVIGLTEKGFAVSVGGVPVNVVAKRMPESLSDAGVTHPKVTVRGVAELLLDQAPLVGGHGGVIGVKVDVSSPDDIAIVPDLEYLARRNGRLTMFALVGFAAALAFVLALFAVLFVRQRKRLFKSRTIMEERRRMADDLHDTIEQHLVGAGMMLGLGRVKEAQDALAKAKRETRDVVWGLKNDDMMRLSPAEMLHELAHDETAKGLCRVEARLEGLPQRLDAAQMRDLSLIVREVIGNAVKHGGAKMIAMSSDPLGRGGWLLRISNDGTPFDPATAPGAAEGHFGLEGMRQRALRLGAEVSIARRKTGMVVEIRRNGKETK